MNDGGVGRVKRAVAFQFNYQELVFIIGKGDFLCFITVVRKTQMVNVGYAVWTYNETSVPISPARIVLFKGVDKSAYYGFGCLIINNLPPDTVLYRILSVNSDRYEEKTTNNTFSYHKSIFLTCRTFCVYYAILYVSITIKSFMPLPYFQQGF